MTGFKNASYEEGHYNKDGVAELQIPNEWVMWFAKDGSANPISEWPFYRPECRVLPKHQVPPEEHDLFYWEGDTTLKWFGYHKSWQAALAQTVTLDPGIQQVSIGLFPDVYVSSAPKVPARDSLTAMIRFFFLSDGGSQFYSKWRTMKPYLVKERYSWEFVTLGDKGLCGWQFRMGHPVKNTGVFMDAAKLIKIGDLDKECRGAPREEYARTYYVFPQNADWATYGQTVRNLFEERKTIGTSWDDAGIGDLDKRTAAMVDVEDRGVAVEWFDEHYPGVNVAFVDVKDKPGPPDPTPKGIKVCMHLQRTFSGYRDILARAHHAGKPFNWVKIVAENLQAIDEIKRESPSTKAWLRILPEEADHEFLYAEDPFAFLDKSSVAPKFDEALALGFDAFESPINERIGTGPGAERDRVANVRFDVAFAEWAYNRSNGQLPTVLLTAPGGNPDHGAETRQLIPGARAAIETGGYLGPHPYGVALPTPGIAEQWMLDPQVQLDFHLRPSKSWEVEFDKAELPPRRYLEGEYGPIGALVNHLGNPVGYKDSGCGWRRHDCMAGNTVRYVDWLVMTEHIIQQYLEIQARAVFTSGYTKWAEFQTNFYEWSMFLDKILV